MRDIAGVVGDDVSAGRVEIAHDVARRDRVGYFFCFLSRSFTNTRNTSSSPAVHFGRDSLPSLVGGGIVRLGSFSSMRLSRLPLSFGMKKPCLTSIGKSLSTLPVMRRVVTI